MRTFTETTPDVLRSKLSAAQSVLLDEGPVEALQSLSHGGRNRVVHLGPSFFTKFLHAVNPPDDTSTQRALIMDRFVAIALNDIDGWGIDERPGSRPAEDYARWLAHAHALAQMFSSSSTSTPAEVIRADAVEMAYFRHGKRVERQRRDAN